MAHSEQAHAREPRASAGDVARAAGAAATAGTRLLLLLLAGAEIGWLAGIGYLVVRLVT